MVHLINFLSEHLSRFLVHIISINYCSLKVYAVSEKEDRTDVIVWVRQAWCWALSVGPSPATASRAFLSTPCIRPGWSTRGSSRSIG